jgi:hypothetical protein
MLIAGLRGAHHGINPKGLAAEQKQHTNLSGPAAFGKDAARLMANVWALDLNVEFHEMIKQRCFPV